MPTQHICLSVPALLLLLARFCSTGTGRVRHEADQLAFAGCLRLLLDAVAVKFPEFDLLLFPKGCAFEWPLMLQAKVSLETCKVCGCMIEGSALSAGARKHMPKPLPHRLHLCDVLIGLASAGKEQSDWLPGVAMQLGFMLQDYFQSMQSKAGLEEKGETKWQKRRYLAQYVVASKSAFQDSRHFSLSFDASSVGGKKVLLGVLAASNTPIGALLPPQVCMQLEQ
eukprot:5555401-Amphidinium_carterae.1